MQCPLLHLPRLQGGCSPDELSGPSPPCPRLIGGGLLYPQSRVCPHRRGQWNCPRKLGRSQKLQRRSLGQEGWSPPGLVGFLSLILGCQEPSLEGRILSGLPVFSGCRLPLSVLSRNASPPAAPPAPTKPFLLLTLACLLYFSACLHQRHAH